MREQQGHITIADLCVGRREERYLYRSRSHTTGTTTPLRGAGGKEGKTLSFAGPGSNDRDHAFLTGGATAQQPAHGKHNKPQRRDHQRLTGIILQRQQHQHERKERHHHPAHHLTQRHLKT